MNKEAGSTNEDHPLVSVVIPTYGRNEHLPEALESVVNQTYSNIELLIVDDGSPIPVTETLPDMSFNKKIESVNLIRHNENRGANAARNTGIRAATGKYLAFLDDDDKWHKSKIRKQVKVFEKSSSRVGVVYTGKRTNGPNGTTYMQPSADGDVIRDLLVGKEFGQFSSVMIKADAIEKVGLPDEALPAWQDREWFFRLAKQYHFKPISEPLTHRRIGLPDRITKDFEKKRDIAYPLFVKKHYPFAREYGYFYARSFIATLRLNIARSAIQANRYKEARKHFLRAFLSNPLHWPVYPHLLASVGGKWTYKTAAFLRKKTIELLSKIV